MIGSRLLRTFAVALGLGALASGAGACVDAREGDESGRGDAIADVGPTDVKRQTVGNCWLYGANAWLEALHAKATGERTDLSEGYLTYWYWFGQLADASAADAPLAKLKEGAYWEVGSELVARYGLMHEADFLADGSLGWLHVSPTRDAMKNVNEALGRPTSALRLAMRTKDRAAIRRAYDDLWKLPDAIRADLDATFGPERARSFRTLAFAAPAWTRVIPPSSFAVRAFDPATQQVSTMTAADVVAGGRAAWTARVVTVDVAKDHAARREFERPLHPAQQPRLPHPKEWKDDKKPPGDHRPSSSAPCSARCTPGSPSPSCGWWT